MATREGGHDGSHERSFAAEQDLIQVPGQRLAEKDGVVQRPHALLYNAHGITASPWAIDADTTGVLFPRLLRRSPHA
jgi:hypothetical protein